MNERMESIKFDDKKGLENLKETDNFYLDPELQKELRDLTVGDPEVLRENSSRILSNLKGLREKDQKLGSNFQLSINDAREYTNILRPCHETSGQVLLQILEDGKFLPQYEVAKQYPGIKSRTTETDKGINSDLSVFCTFDLFRGFGGNNYSVIFKKEILEKPSSYFSFNDIAALIPNYDTASSYQSKRYLDEYRKRVIPGKDAPEVLAEIAATFKNRYEDFHSHVSWSDEIFEKIGIPKSSAAKAAGHISDRPEIHLLSPTVDDIEAVVINDWKEKDEVVEKEVLKKLKKLGIPFKYCSDIDVEGQKLPETFFKELEKQQ